MFDKLKANQESISGQTLLTPIPVRLSAEGAAELLANKALLDELGFEIEEFGENTVLLRQIPMDLSAADAAAKRASRFISVFPFLISVFPFLPSGYVKKTELV